MTDLVVRQSGGVPEAYSPDWIGLVKSQVAKGATDDELKLFLYQCQKTGLDPLARQIYFQKRRTKNGEQMTILTGIDGYRLTANRTGKYAGSDDPVFDDEDNPRKATVTIYKIVGDMRCPFTASARWSQYYPGDAQGFMWNKMPHLMLSKCAEALALRKAFPAELSGVYTKEEMDQAGPVVEVDAQVYEPPKPKLAAPARREEPFEIPFGSGPPEEVYMAEVKQKKMFVVSAQRAGLDTTDIDRLRAYSEKCIGIPVPNLEAAIRELMEEEKQ